MPTLKADATATLSRLPVLEVTRRWYRYFSTRTPTSTLKVDTTAMLSRLPVLEVTRRWYRHFSKNGRAWAIELY
jgi:hypothetical protein